MKLKLNTNYTVAHHTLEFRQTMLKHYDKPISDIIFKNMLIDDFDGFNIHHPLIVAFELIKSQLDKYEYNVDEWLEYTLIKLYMSILILENNESQN